MTYRIGPTTTANRLLLLGLMGIQVKSHTHGPHRAFRFCMDSTCMDIYCDTLKEALMQFFYKTWTLVHFGPRLEMWKRAEASWHSILEGA